MLFYGDQQKEQMSLEKFISPLDAQNNKGSSLIILKDQVLPMKPQGVENLSSKTEISGFLTNSIKE